MESEMGGGDAKAGRLVWMSIAHITTRKHRDVPGWGSWQGPHGCPGAVHNGPYPSLDVLL